MDRRSAIAGRAVVGPVVSTPTGAQALRNARIAWVTFAHPEPDSPFLQRFRGWLCELGWVEGRDLALDLWGGDGSAARIEDLVAMMVVSKPDVVAAGLVQSYAQPSHLAVGGLRGKRQPGELGPGAARERHQPGRQRRSNERRGPASRQRRAAILPSRRKPASATSVQRQLLHPHAGIWGVRT
jgi:hypothetical protein